MRGAAAIFALWAVAPAPSVAFQSVGDNQFEFAKTKIGKFELSATTDIEWHDSMPFVADVTCTGDNQNLRFTVDRATRLRDLNISFLGSPEPDGDRPYITLLGDDLWLFVDDKRFEFRNIPLPSNRFSNASYPPTPKGEIVLPDWRGYRAVRSSQNEPFQEIGLIYGSLISAKKVEWAFKSRNWLQVDRKVPENALPPGWEHRRYPIDNKDLKLAVQWCAAAVVSDAARLLPQQTLKAGQ